MLETERERLWRRLWWPWRALLVCVGAVLLVQALEHTVWAHDPHRRASNVVEFALEAPDDELILEWRLPDYDLSLEVDVRFFDLEVAGSAGESGTVQLHYYGTIRGSGSNGPPLKVVDIGPGTEQVDVQHWEVYGRRSPGPLWSRDAVYLRLVLVDDGASIRGKVVARASPIRIVGFGHGPPPGFERPRWPFSRGDRLELRVVDALPDDVG